MYYRNAQAALVVYDLTKPSSLTKAKHWVAELQRQASPGIVIALVGNKLDLTNDASDGGDGSASSPDQETGSSPTAEEGGSGGDAENDNEGDEGEDGEASDGRKISTREASTYAEEEGLLFFETSAKSGTNVAEVFTAIANSIPETSLKGSRGTAVAGSGQGALGAGGRTREDSRVNLGDVSTANEGCAC